MSYANLGDSGLILLRHIDSEVAGTVYRDRTKPRPERKSDLRIAFLSQQQLRSFNLPYQLGYNGKDEATAKDGFEQPTDANVTGYSTRPGDIVIVATDGRSCAGRGDAGPAREGQGLSKAGGGEEVSWKDRLHWQQMIHALLVRRSA